MLGAKTTCSCWLAQTQNPGLGSKGRRYCDGPGLKGKRKETRRNEHGQIGEVVGGSWWERAWRP